MPASSFIKREHTGGAVDTTITADITSTSLTIGIASSTGWPTGGANGPFIAIIDYDVAGKEKVEVQSRTGTTLTIADTGKRGIDGTSAASHVTGAKIRHCNSALEANEWSQHVSNDAAMTKHTSAALATDSVTQTQIAANSVGTSELIDANVTLAKLAANSVDASKIVDGSVGTNDLANLGVTTGKLADLNVTTAKLADLNVTTAKIADANVTLAKLATDSVDASKIAANAVGTAEIANAVVTMAKFASEAGTSFTPDFPNVDIGPAGVKWGRYFKFGRLVVGIAGFQLGIGVSSVFGTVSFTVPTGASTVFDAFSGSGSTGWITAARATDVSTGFVGSGLGTISDTGGCSNYVIAGASAQWDATTPFTWNDQDSFFSVFLYEALT